MTHLSGIYYLPIELMKKQLGFTDTAIAHLFDHLSSQGLASHDQDTETVFVLNMFSYQGKGEKNERAAANHLKTLHHSCLIHDFLQRYPVVKQYCDPELLDRVSDRVLDRVSDTPSDPSKRCPPVSVSSSESSSVSLKRSHFLLSFLNSILVSTMT